MHILFLTTWVVVAEMAQWGLMGGGSNTAPQWAYLSFLKLLLRLLLRVCLEILAEECTYLHALGSLQEVGHLEQEAGSTQNAEIGRRHLPSQPDQPHSP
jgi:hypothetical protein